ncbi:MAG: tRNA1(Val) (adenine(37)-N6)-methyltransferase [Deltaproteobacteria bacterium]|nr:tRNA1(Val) (adenine(37)-N6)-methyltransferase [Deltaproteobacteria bacterium]
MGSKIKIFQPEKGYRFSIDPFILAAHIEGTGNQKVIDIGCGCGIIPLILSLKSSALKITGIEIQKELYDCAKKNILTNKLENSINIIHGDIKNIDTSDINGKADIIVSNPPYKKKGSGRLNPDSQKAIARHEITLDIDMLFKCSGRLLKEKSRLYIIFPAQRLSDLVLTMEHYSFSPEFIRFVHTKKYSTAKRVILCAGKNSNSPCVVHPPFYIYEDENKFSKEYLSLFKDI